MKTYNISRLPSMLCIGYDGENNWRPQAFDCTPLLENHPNGTITLWLLPDGETRAFPVALERDGNTVVWTPLSEEMTARTGALQIVCTDGTDVGKSRVALFRVDSSIIPGAEHPAAVPSWATQTIERAEDAAERAEEAAESIDIDAIEAQIAQAVADYLAEHPIEYTETDPTVPEWAKQPNKPTYTAAEVGAVADTANTTNNLGFCYVNIGVGQTSTELIGTNANYVPKNGGIIVGRFLNDAPANATINISGKGAKAVYYRNSPITAGVIKAGDVAAFIFYPERYYLIAIDRWQADINDIRNAGYQTSAQVQAAIENYIEAHDITGEDSRLDFLATFTESEETVVPLFTNQLPISTDTDGTIFYGVGYHEGYRFNSSGEEVAATGVYTTGFIPATRDSILRFSDIGMYVEEHTGVSLNHIYICTYDSSKTFTSAIQLFKMLNNTPGCMIVVDGKATEIDFSKTADGNYGVRTGTAFVRISAYEITANSIITVNEEIAYDEHGEITSAALKPAVDIPQLTPLDERITALENGEGGSGATKDERLDSVVTFTEETGRVPLFTNVIPLSVDTDGTPYQSGNGYLEGYRLNSSGGLTESATGGVTGFIPLPTTGKESAVLRFAGMYLGTYNSQHNTNDSRINFYDASFQWTHGQQTVQSGSPWVVHTDENGYITEIDFAEQTASTVTPRSTDAYIRVSAYGLGADSIITINEEIAYDEHGEITSATLKSDVNIPQLAPLDARITALEEDEGGGTIDSTDPLVKYAKQIDNGLTVGYEPTLTGRPTAELVAKKYLNFLHISDTHGSVNAENAVKILNKLKADGRCSFLIHTGDFHASTFADVASWNTFAGYIAQATAPVLLVSGNHDVGNNSQSTTNGQTATDAQLYARCFEPYINGWGLTSHPTGKCYWYKDFADEGVRLIGLYDFESDYATDSTTGDLLYKRGYAAYHQAQIDWLVQALLTCPAGYGVIIAKHNPMNLRGDLDNPFNGEFLRGQNTSQSFVSKDMIAEIVQAFMDGATINKTFAQTGNVTDTLTVNQSFASKNSGAHFICYLDGHTHADGVNFLADFPNQLELNIGCDNYHYQHYADTLNQQETLHQDLMNYVSVDVNRGYVYIQRIGNDYTAQADRRDFTAIDYKNPPEAVDLDEIDARLDALEAMEAEAFETIADVTFDGSTVFGIDTDSNGQPFQLKKAVLLVTIGNATANGTVTILFKFQTVFVHQAYASYAANASGRTMFAKAWAENGRWFGEHTSFNSNGYGTFSTQTNSIDVWLYKVTSLYPCINNISTSSPWTPPQGTRAFLVGVRA